MSAKLIVYPPDEQGWRKVRYDGFSLPPGWRTPRTWTSPIPTSWNGEAPAPRRGIPPPEAISAPA